ncbi:MAG TPA: hypothetical protein VFU13_09820 [Steroidobacteraceae bacterium]|nr:hypothetical protein [Steroidobacteraceae bacterium]
MAEIHSSGPDPADQEPLQISTPVIDMQDLEHVAGPATRVSNKGVRVEPRIDNADVRDFARDDEDALHALEEIEQALHGQLPG